MYNCPFRHVWSPTVRQMSTIHALNSIHDCKKSWFEEGWSWIPLYAVPTLRSIPSSSCLNILVLLHFNIYLLLLNLHITCSQRTSELMIFSQNVLLTIPSFQPDYSNYITVLHFSLHLVTVRGLLNIHHSCTGHIQWYVSINSVTKEKVKCDLPSIYIQKERWVLIASYQSILGDTHTWEIVL